MTTELIPSPEESSAAGIAQAAGIIALGNITSRLLGLVRETIIADLFGATASVSAYRLAARVPTMIYDLLIGGMVSAALVPVFSEYAPSERKDELGRIASTMLNLTLLTLTAVVIALELLAPQVAWLLGGGFGPELQALSTTLVRIILPSIVFFGLSGVLTGLLYAQKRFVFPAFGAAIFNLGIIVGALLLASRLDVASLTVGIVLGALLQVAIQVPGLRGLKLGLVLDWRHPGLRRIAALYAPVVLGLIISQLAVALDTTLASRAGEQVLAWMQNATTLIQFPLGLVVTAISMAVLPSLARLSVSRGECSVESQVELGDFRRTLATGLRMVLVLIVPATVGLGVLARPIVQLLFEHGAFTANDTAMTVLALDFYLIGLPFAAIDQPLVYAFYARKDTVTPVLVGVMAIGVYTVVALALIGPLGMTGLVLANSAQWFSHAVVMVTLLHRRLDGLRGQRLELAAAKALAASAAMAIAVWAALAWVQGVVAGEGLAAKATRLGVAGLVAFAVYAAALVVLRVDEVRFIREAVARRLDAGRGIGV